MATYYGDENGDERFEADSIVAGLENAARMAARLRKNGGCPHSWIKGGWAGDPNIPTKCLDCGKQFPTWTACNEDIQSQRENL